MKNIMVDIETLGTKPGCVILSIGAIGFNPLGSELSYTPHTRYVRRGLIVKTYYIKKGDKCLDSDDGQVIEVLETDVTLRFDGIKGVVKKPNMVVYQDVNTLDRFCESRKRFDKYYKPMCEVKEV